jgi:hypothetical protein
MRAHAHTNRYTNTHEQALGKFPTGIGAEMAKMFLARVRGYPELPCMLMNFGFRGENGKVRYRTNIYMYTNFTATSFAPSLQAGE